MKKIKLLLPMLAFVFAIAGAFATEYLDVFGPTAYDPPGMVACEECEEPQDGATDPDGDVYRRIDPDLIDTPGEYVCDDELVNIRCYCRINDDEDWSTTSLVGGTAKVSLSECINLYKLFPAGDND